MSGHLKYAVQKAVVARLLATMPLTTLIGPNVFDNVPEDITFDFISFGNHTARPWNTKSDDGQEILFWIDLWSRDPSRGKLYQMQKAVYDALHNQASSLTLSGGSVTLCQWDYEDDRMDLDGKTWHGVQRYRILASE